MELDYNTPPQRIHAQPPTQYRVIVAWAKVIPLSFAIPLLKSRKISSWLQTGMFALFAGISGKLLLRLAAALVIPAGHEQPKGVAP